MEGIQHLDDFYQQLVRSEGNILLHSSEKSTFYFIFHVEGKPTECTFIR